jgi:hypothetical protein
MVNINGEVWRVLLVSPNHHQLWREDEKRYAIGVCDDDLKTIYIKDGLPDSYFKKVLAHELTHAAMFSYNIELTWEQEEILADLIATYGQEIVHITNLVFKRIIEKRRRL